uniref:Ankyrin repeat-containing protein ITN1-like n=2 Tax=Cicer arietinum TaxID=3827 RepID=A0A3Q7Y7Z1_CICAR|nr:ankyrin repeat-containing protein ITN1-like [Cicer arietinum]XP_027187472.1 ankyrin repeat-containing protein ITN1-like [Cicer arietinum]
MKIAKKKHEWSSQLLKELMKRPYEAFTGKVDLDSNIDFDKYDTYLQKLKETPFLVAARNGIVEMVNEILNKVPSAIHNINSKKENALHVAVKHRHPIVVETLKKHSDPQVWSNMVLAVDKDDNTILHLAADVLHEDKASKVPGSALQMMWDIKWFEYIQSLVPHHFYFIGNKISSQTSEGRSNDNTGQTPDGRSNDNTSQTPDERSNNNTSQTASNNNTSKTPDEIFRSKHTTLIKDGSEWLKDTSESCSVVAALVAGVSFATASAVPGGTTDEGTPTLEGKPAFDIFAISSLVGLCFSVTGLIMFLSILTSRKQPNDFRRDLPLKLLLGLTSLFVAIASMFVSFCTGHFFLLNHKYESVMFPLYGATSIPVTFYAVAQFPLYYDLVTAILTEIPTATVQSDKL